MIVKAAVANAADLPPRIETLELDEPQADEVLVRLVASGVGLDDRDAIATGAPIAYPFVPGREGAGIVERVGAAVDDLAPGDAVVLGPAFCRHCPACLGGHPGACREGATLNIEGRRRDGTAPFARDGRPINGFFHGQSSFATHVLCHVSCAARVASDAPLEILACVGGEARLAVDAVLHGLGLEPGDTIVITGADAAGLFATIAARQGGARAIIVADPDDARRALATELGATLTVHADDDLAAVTRSLIGDGARLALDTTGHDPAIAACLESIGPGGLLGRLRPSPWGGGDLSVDAQSMGSKRVLDLSRGAGAPHATIRTLVGWHAEGRLPLEKLVAYFPFEHINDAVAALTTRAVVKPILRFSIGPFADLDRAIMEGAAIEAPADTPAEDAPAEDRPVPVEAPVVAT